MPCERAVPRTSKMPLLTAMLSCPEFASAVATADHSKYVHTINVGFLCEQPAV